jgi:hypothetical protein
VVRDARRCRAPHHEGLTDLILRSRRSARCRAPHHEGLADLILRSLRSGRCRAPHHEGLADLILRSLRSGRCRAPHHKGLTDLILRSLRSGRLEGPRDTSLQIRLRDLAAFHARGLKGTMSLEIRGRRESRVPGAPAAVCIGSKHTVVTTSTPKGQNPRGEEARSAVSNHEARGYPRDAIDAALGMRVSLWCRRSTKILRARTAD